MDCPYLVILPYFSEQEIDRYEKIADKMLSLGPQKNRFEFLLAASPKIEPSDRLFRKMSQVATCHHFSCPTQIFGYPEGPTAMFWDCMDHLHDTNNGDGGFGLWFESDMIPAKSDWLDRIVEDWEYAADVHPTAIDVMGCYVPKVHKKRFFRAQRVWVPEHVNGGACYAKDFTSNIPARFRKGTFDMVIFEHLKQNSSFAATESIAFSTIDRCRLDMADPRRAVLHGFMQEKDAFVNKCLPPTTDAELEVAQAMPNARREAINRELTKIKLRFVKRGQRAMLEALLMEQKEFSKRRAA